MGVTSGQLVSFMPLSVLSRPIDLTVSLSAESGASAFHIPSLRRTLSETFPTMLAAPLQRLQSLQYQGNIAYAINPSFLVCW